MVTVDKCRVSWLVQADTPAEAVERAHERHVRGEHPERVQCEETMAVIEEVNMLRVNMDIDELLRENDGGN
jgi:hypothetical protein